MSCHNFGGIGICPTLYYRSGSASSKYKFDSPVILKIGYNRKFAGIAFIYKYGLFNTLSLSDDISKGKINEFLLQLFIPF